jgi:fructokinase
VEWLVCSTLSLAFEHSSEAVHHLVDRGLAGGARLYVDVNWRNVFWSNEQVAREKILEFAQRADVVKLTDEEAMWLLGIPDALACPQDVSECFPRAFAVLVTAGEKGASYSIFRHCGKVEPFRVDVKETTGAGDAFTAGFLHALSSLDHDTLEEEPQFAENMVRFAAAVGALTCTRDGAIAAQPTMNEVEAFLIHGQKVWA